MKDCEVVYASFYGENPKEADRYTVSFFKRKGKNLEKVGKLSVADEYLTVTCGD